MRHMSRGISLPKSVSRVLDRSWVFGCLGRRGSDFELVSLLLPDVDVVFACADL